ncbi:DUF5946 family protein [Paenibacillus sp. 32352]|uniref:DUF5946 family protein n=1 Tax=Paenibacillus sp. 32352 TaxID=1969111 RepID=UPI0009AEEAC3|nr:DUF5946 family protein [Paenibacillus sp. 32352]
MSTCTVCGAVLLEGKTCETIFNEFMAFEFMDPGYGRVHFLTVACYMVQHERYSDAAYVWIQSALRNYLEKAYTIEWILQDAAQGPGSTKDILRNQADPTLPKVEWTMTIADVAAQMDDAESYCQLIERWAHITLKEMGPLILNKG